MRRTRRECRDTMIAGERGSASAHVRSTRADEENDQRTSSRVDDKPEAPPDPPPPLTNPSAPSARENTPPSIELEGETRRSAALSCDVECTEGEADASGASYCDEDARGWPKKLRNVSERVSKRSERQSRENSPRKVPDDEAVVPGDLQSTQECPKGDRNERVVPRYQVWRA